MKLAILSAFLFIAVSASSCLSNKTSNPTPVTPPTGIFAGTFKLIHTAGKTNKRDTLSANLILAMSTSTGFKVTGDTSTVHAGSYGNFRISTSYIEFVDATLSLTNPGTKTHLSGTYQYQYDGTTFQILYNPSDTLSFQYNLKKTN